MFRNTSFYATTRHFSFVIHFSETNVIVLLVFHFKKKLYFHVCDWQHLKNTKFYNSWIMNVERDREQVFKNVASILVVPHPFSFLCAPTSECLTRERDFRCEDVFRVYIQ